MNYPSAVSSFDTQAEERVLEKVMSASNENKTTAAKGKYCLPSRTSQMVKIEYSRAQ